MVIICSLPERVQDGQERRPDDVVGADVQQLDDDDDSWGGIG